MNRRTQPKGFTLIELMIVVAIIGILAAIAIPNFIKFQARSKQSECKANLKALFTAQKSYFQEKDGYSSVLSDIGFSPERGNRYAYRNGTADSWQVRTGVDITATDVKVDDSIEVDTFKFPNAVKDPAASTVAAITWSSAVGAAPTDLGVTGNCPGCNFYANCAGDIDSESAGIDTWIISSASATVADAPGNSDTAAPAGVPFNTYNDVNVDT